MRPKSLVLLLLALGCGLVASIGISQVMDKGAPIEAETAPIYVAIKDIAFNEQLTQNNVKLEEWPKSKVPPGSLSKPEDIAEHRANGKILVGEPILNGKLWGPGEGNTVSKDIPKGYRLATVQVDNVSGQSGMIRPGDRVDVMVFVSQNGNSGVTETATRTILQDIQVFAIDQSVRKTNDKEEATATAVAKTVSLLVTPEQGQKVSLASEIGKVRLSLRRLDDDTAAVTKPVTIDELFGVEKSNRDAEDEGVTEAAATGAQPVAAGGGITDWLGKAMAASSAQPPAPTVNVAPMPQQENFSMELLTGGEVKKVEFKRSEARWAPAPPAQPTQVEPQPAPTAPAAQTNELSAKLTADQI